MSLIHHSKWQTLRNAQGASVLDDACMDILWGVATNTGCGLEDVELRPNLDTSPKSRFHYPCSCIGEGEFDGWLTVGLSG